MKQAITTRTGSDHENQGETEIALVFACTATIDVHYVGTKSENPHRERSRNMKESETTKIAVIQLVGTSQGEYNINRQHFIFFH